MFSLKSDGVEYVEKNKDIFLSKLIKKGKILIELFTCSDGFFSVTLISHVHQQHPRSEMVLTMTVTA